MIIFTSDMDAYKYNSETKKTTESLKVGEPVNQTEVIGKSNCFEES